ncbi:MAG: hypothetical protein V5804_12065 [Mucilaginibacter sp.]|uniref:hypothetical protein n=1 Tax=Mucilaginibacter sp. TaxID=1882438 RepID=UPI0034E519C5
MEQGCEPFFNAVSAKEKKEKPPPVKDEKRDMAIKGSLMRLLEYFLGKHKKRKTLTKFIHFNVVIVITFIPNKKKIFSYFV